MKYTILEVKDEVSREQALTGARKSFEKIKKDLDKNLPVAIIYGITIKGKPEYFAEQIVCKTDKELQYETNKLKEKYPNSTILVLYKHHLSEDSKPIKDSIELHYEDLELTLAGAYHPDSYDKSVGGMGGWSPGYNDDLEVTEDYDLELEEEEVADALWDIIMSNDGSEDALERELQEKPENEAWNYIFEHVEELAEKYEADLLEHFKEEAIEKATEYWQDKYDDYDPYDDYEPDYEPDYDDYDEPEPEPEEPDYDDEW